MRTGLPLSKAAGGLAMLIVIVSAVFVIAHQCHGDQSTNGVASQAISGHDATHGVDGAAVGLPVTGLMGSSLFGEICASVVFLVLVVGGKFLLRVFKNRYRMKFAIFWARSKLIFYDRWLGTALSLPQLGVCRI